MKARQAFNARTANIICILATAFIDRRQIQAKDELRLYCKDRAWYRSLIFQSGDYIQCVVKDVKVSWKNAYWLTV
jgi:hypothetical protein